MSDNEKVLPNTPSEHAICSRECGLHRELGGAGQEAVTIKPLRGV